MKEYLLTAGPTPVPERVLLAMARPMLYHRSPPFTECLREVQEGLRWLLQTKQLPLLSCPARARSAMDAAVCNFLRTGDKAIVIRGGKFGERWGKICQAYGIECVFIDVEWGKSVDPKVVAEALDENPGVRAVYATASETSTATKHDVEAMAKVVTGTDDVILCVDAITAVGVYDVPIDEWGLDVVCRRLAEGVDVAARAGDRRRVRQGVEGERAREPAALLSGPAARAEEPGEGRDRVHAGGVAGRRAARIAAHAQGRDAGGVWHRHERLAKATRAASGGLGLELFSSSPANSVTGVPRAAAASTARR